MVFTYYLVFDKIYLRKEVIMDWIFWLILVIILSVLEAVTVNLVSIWFVISGIITMILSFIITDTAVLSSIFVILGILFLIITRPIVAKLRNSGNDKTNLDRIIGMEGVVTLDITMPVVDGVEALKMIKALDPESKVVMVTAAGQKNKMIECIKAGANEFLTKPFEQQEIVDVINKMSN